VANRGLMCKCSMDIVRRADVWRSNIQRQRKAKTAAVRAISCVGADEMLQMFSVPLCAVDIAMIR